MKLEEKREIKTFPCTNTHRTTETTPVWVSYTLPRAEPLLSCYTLLVEQFASQQHLQVARNLLLLGDLAADLC